MALTFQRELFANALPGISALLADHWREVAYPGGFPRDDYPSVDAALYQSAEDEGRFVVFTLRDGDSIPGYAAFWIGPFPQRKGMIGAWQEAIFIDKQHRATEDGISFIGKCDDALRAMGVSVVHHSVRQGRDFSPVLIRAGYVPVETVYAKNLG